jgi:hypothetical protein
MGAIPIKSDDVTVVHSNFVSDERRQAYTRAEHVMGVMVEKSETVSGLKRERMSKCGK